MNFKRISVDEARQLIAADKPERLSILDVRDEESYRAGSLPGAQHLHGGNLESLTQDLEMERPVLVYCYHGHMSQAVAARLAEQGFTQVYSMDGGFEDWSQTKR